MSKARIGMAGLVRILAQFADRPATKSQARDGADVGRNTAWRTMASFYALGLVHIADWSIDPGRCASPMYLLGPGDDVPAPTVRPDGRPLAHYVPRQVKKHPVHIVALRSLLDELKAPIARHELVEATGLNRYTVRSTIDALVQHRMAHIAMWSSRANFTGPPVPQYQLGRRPNAPRPKPLSDSEVNRRWRARKQQCDVFRPLQAVFSRRINDASASPA